MHPGTSLTDAIREREAGWSTPVARDARHGTTGVRDQLPDQAKTWATPTTKDRPGRPTMDRDLPREALAWPTPVASEARRQTHAAEGREGSLGLTDAVRGWPTPTAGDAVGATGYMSGDQRDTFRPSLNTAARMNGPPGPTTRSGGPTSPPSGPTSSRRSLRKGQTKRIPRRLNPKFVEWLQGFPDGWSAVSPSDGPLADRVARLHALGNGCSPAQAELALRVLVERALADDAPSPVPAK